MVARFLHRQPVAQNTNTLFASRATLGERVADRVAAFGGSWPFIFLFMTIMSFWMLMNLEGPKTFDPYPFILLNLLLSCLAALQAPIIMMSQNRQAAKDRLDAQQDYEVNLKAEMEIMTLHMKLDELRQQQRGELIALQERQLACLERLDTLLTQTPGGASGSSTVSAPSQGEATR
jgi:uncharacterized membrane protein